MTKPIQKSFPLWLFLSLMVILPSTNCYSAAEDVADYEMKTLELLAKIDAFTEDDPVLRLDAAKAHYNMGNIYFQKGKYEIASREYYQAVTLMPDDPDAHYNLAYVSGEHLNDFQTALKHYKLYLYLQPDAADAHLVRGKIREAELALRAVVDSPLEEELKKNK
jgi:tetratricopeptide (TPR) repeat protein